MPYEHTQVQGQVPAGGFLPPELPLEDAFFSPYVEGHLAYFPRVYLAACLRRARLTSCDIICTGWSKIVWTKKCQHSIDGSAQIEDEGCD